MRPFIFAAHSPPPPQPPVIGPSRNPPKSFFEVNSIYYDDFKHTKKPTVVFLSALPLLFDPNSAYFEVFFHTDFYVNNLQIILLISSSSIIDNYYYYLSLHTEPCNISRKTFCIEGLGLCCYQQTTFRNSHFRCLWPYRNILCPLLSK